MAIVVEGRNETAEAPRRGRKPRVEHPVSARSRIVGAAARLMRWRGYSAMGLNDIVAEGQAPKGSIYHYFPGGKEQIAGEANQAGGRIVVKRIAEAFEAGVTVPRTLRYFAELLARNLEQSQFRDGCPVATTTLDAASESSTIQLSCAESFDRWRDAIASELVNRGWGIAEADDTAILWLSSFEGALIIARATRDVQPLHTVAESLARSFEKS